MNDDLQKKITEGLESGEAKPFNVDAFLNDKDTERDIRRLTFQTNMNSAAVLVLALAQIVLVIKWLVSP